MKKSFIWVIQSSENLNIIGCFTNKEKAEKYIRDNELKCVITQYPIDISVYDWVVLNDYWTPKNDVQKSAEFKERFNSAYLEQGHYIQDED